MIKRKYIKRKAWNKLTTPFPNKWKRNLTKVRITTKGNGSVSMNMEKGGITMNIMMMTLTSMTMTLNKFLSIETETKQQKSGLYVGQS